MLIPEIYSEFFHLLNPGERKTLQDNQTKLYIRVKSEMYYVDVDRGIIPNDREGIKKCDFLCYDERNMKCHLIELKGAVIKKAYEQIDETVKNIESDERISFLINGLQQLDAYIVSSGRQEIPKGIDETKRQLARKLAKKSSHRPKNIEDLVICVKVVRHLSRLTQVNGQIICSNNAPLDL